MSGLEGVFSVFLGWCNPTWKIFCCLKMSVFVSLMYWHSLWTCGGEKFPRWSMLCRSTRSYFLCLDHPWLKHSWFPREIMVALFCNLSDLLFPMGLRQSLACHFRPCIHPGCKVPSLGAAWSGRAGGAPMYSRKRSTWRAAWPNLYRPHPCRLRGLLRISFSCHGKGVEI